MYHLCKKYGYRMVNVIFNVKENCELEGKGDFVFLVNHKYFSSSEAKEELSKILGSEVYANSLIGNFKKVQYFRVKSSPRFQRRIKLEKGNGILIGRSNNLNVQSYTCSLEFDEDIRKSELEAYIKILKNSINYFVDEYLLKFHKGKKVLDSENPEQLLVNSFHAFLEERYQKGKTKEIIKSCLKEKKVDKLDVVKDRNVKEVTKSIIKEDYDRAKKYFPKNPLKKYIMLYLHKYWNKRVSEFLSKNVIESAKIEYKNLITALKIEMPYISYNTTISLLLHSNNELAEKFFEEDRKKLKSFIDFYDIKDYERDLFVDYIDIDYSKNKIVYEVKPKDNFISGLNLIRDVISKEDSEENNEEEE